MEKITLSDVLGGFNLNKINDNFRKIGDVFNSRSLDKNGDTLLGDLDVNGKRLYNLPAPADDNSPARLKDVRNAIYGAAGHTANLIDFAPGDLVKANNIQGAVEQVARSLYKEFTTITTYGCVGDGVTNNTVNMRKAIKENLSLDVPAGTYLFAPTADSGDFLLYLGTGNGFQTPRDGLTIRGRGDKSVLKLGDNVGRNVNLFAAASNDKLKDITFKDICIDLNGLNNLQTDFNNPLRYNAFAYFFCYCENITFDNVTILNGSGHQMVRVGADTPETYGKNIRILKCRVKNYGMGVPGNKSQDTSCFYIQADQILADGNVLECDPFPYDPARGHTGFEFHGDMSTIIVNSKFRNLQMPWLMASSQKSSNNVRISGNQYSECFYLGSLDGLYYDQKNFDIGPGEMFTSTRSAASILRLGYYEENPKNRENIRVHGSQFLLWGNNNQDVHFCDLTSCWIRSLEICNNKFGGFTGSVVYYQGIVRNSGYCDINIHNNDLDSMGSTSGVYPNSPTFLHIETAEGVINRLVFNGNSLSNSSQKDYSAYGISYLPSPINFLYVNGNTNGVGSKYPLVTGTPTVQYKSVDVNYPTAWRDSGYETPKFLTIPANGEIALYNFSGFGQDDYASFKITVFVTDGAGANNNSLLDYDVLICGNQKVATKVAGAGAYAPTDVFVDFIGNTLRVKSINGNALFTKMYIRGNSSKSFDFYV